VIQRLVVPFNEVHDLIFKSQKKVIYFVLDPMEHFWYGSVKSRLSHTGGIMTIKFPKEEESLSPEDAHIAYKRLVDYHLHSLKLQSKCEFFYWKLMGIFFLFSIGAFILRGKGMVVDPLIVVTLVGFGCLLIFVQKVRIDLEYGVSAASCIERGIFIEDKYAYPVRLFRIFEDNKILRYRGNLLGRVVPFAFIGLATLIAGCIFAEKVGIWFVIAVGFLAIIGLCTFAKLYISAAKRVILGAGK
jgi:hypothetical protein